MRRPSVVGMEAFVFVALPVRHGIMLRRASHPTVPQVRIAPTWRIRRIKSSGASNHPAQMAHRVAARQRTQRN
jgi:hypothetical protein